MGRHHIDNICIVELTEGKREEGHRKILEVTMARSFANLVKDVTTGTLVKSEERRETHADPYCLTRYSMQKVKVEYGQSNGATARHRAPSAASAPVIRIPGTRMQSADMPKS